MSYINHMAKEINVKICYVADPASPIAAASVNDLYARWNPEQRGELKQLGRVVAGDILLPMKIRDFGIRLHLFAAQAGPPLENENWSALVRGSDALVVIEDGAHLEAVGHARAGLAAHGSDFDAEVVVHQGPNDSVFSVIKEASRAVLKRLATPPDAPASPASPERDDLVDIGGYTFLFPDFFTATPFESEGMRGFDSAPINGVSLGFRVVPGAAGEVADYLERMARVWQPAHVEPVQASIEQLGFQGRRCLQCAALRGEPQCQVEILAAPFGPDLVAFFLVIGSPATSVDSLRQLMHQMVGSALIRKQKAHPEWFR